MTVTIAVANDHRLVIEGLQAILAPYADRITVLEVDLGAPVLSEVDLVLLDTFGSPPGPESVNLATLGPGTFKRVVFTWDVDPAAIKAALDQGADAYLLKSATTDELVDAIERIASGERVVAESGPPIADPIQGRWPGDEHGLSPRESEVLVLICQGLSNAEISKRAYIGINTVKTYIRSAYRKIGATTRPQAVIWGMSNGFHPDRGRNIK